MPKQKPQKDENIDKTASTLAEDSSEPTDQPAPKGGSLSMEERLEQAEARAAEYMDSWKRAAADYQNFKKQQERERQNWIALSNAALLMKVLPVIDDLDTAVMKVENEIRKTAWFEGVALILKKLDNALEEIGVTEIDAKGKKFDPNLHEAVLEEDDEKTESGHITDVIQRGYQLNGKLIRPAMVKVAR